MRTADVTPEPDDFTNFRTLTSRAIGKSDVEMGYRPAYPVTVYAVAGDDTSGIIGMLMPDGEFKPKAEAIGTAEYWEYDETLHYNKVLDAEGQPIVVDGPYGRKYHLTKADSWTEGEVIWNGRAGDVTPQLNMIADVSMFEEDGTGEEVEGELKTFIGNKKTAVIVNRRLNDTNAMTGDWITTGELWRAMERGTQMLGGRQAGRVHELHEEAA